MKFQVQTVKFNAPIAELYPKSASSTMLSEFTPHWSATVDEDVGVMVLKVRRIDPKTSKMKTFSFRLPLSSVQWYTVTAGKAGDEPDEPK